MNLTTPLNLKWCKYHLYQRLTFIHYNYLYLGCHVSLEEHNYCYMKEYQV